MNAWIIFICLVAYAMFTIGAAVCSSGLDESLETTQE